MLLDGNQFDPAVLGASFGRFVAGDEVRLPISVRDQPVFCHAVIDEVTHDRLGTPLRELQVVADRTDRVAVAVHVGGDVRMLLQNFDGLVQDRGVLWADVVLVEIKVHSAQD